MTPASAAKSNAAARAAGWFTSNWDHAAASRAAQSRADALPRVMTVLTDDWQSRADIIRQCIAKGQTASSADNGIDTGIRRGLIERDLTKGRRVVLRTKSGAVLDTAKGQST